MKNKRLFSVLLCSILSLICLADERPTVASVIPKKTTGSFIAAVSDTNTVALWHMERDDVGLQLNDLWGDCKMVASDAVGHALSMDGNDVALAKRIWPAGTQGLEADFLMKINSLESENGVSYLLMSSSWELYITTDQLIYKVYSAPGKPAGILYKRISPQMLDGRWIHVVANYSPDEDCMSLSVDGETQVADTLGKMWVRHEDANIFVGGLAGKPAGRGFNGLLDEVKISSKPAARIRSRDPDRKVVEQRAYVKGGVNLTDKNTSVLLENGRVSIQVVKDTGKIILMQNGETQYMGGDAHSGYGYFLPISNMRTLAPSGGKYNLIADTPERVEFSLRFADAEKFPFIMEYHFVMLKNQSGFYQYAIAEYRSDFAMQDEVTLEAFDYKYRVATDLFKDAVIGDREELLPLPEEVSKPHQVMDATFSIGPDSVWRKTTGHEYYTKYCYTRMRKDLDIMGFTGGRYGFWLMEPEHNYMQSGPFKYGFSLHQTDTGPITFVSLQNNHRTVKRITFNRGDPDWQKLYGPWFVYMNSGLGLRSMKEEAQAVYKAEQKKIPYGWMDHPLYPNQKTRGALKGNIRITDGTAPKGAIFVLTQKNPSEEDHWQARGKGYTAYGSADANGDFVMQNVRPGVYEMMGTIDGIFEEYEKSNIVVKPGETTDLGTLSWTPVKHGKILWQIGTPDRQATEYKHGDDYFETWGRWFDYSKEFPDGVHFTIGTSKESDDWNFAQCNILSGSIVHPDSKASTWHIYFNLDVVPPKGGVLTFGICGCRDSEILVTMNGREVGRLDGLYSDGCYMRSGIRGRNQVRVLTVPPETLRAGKNTIQLIQLRAGGYSGLYYDSIRFEAAE